MVCCARCGGRLPAGPLRRRAGGVRSATSRSTSSPCSGSASCVDYSPAGPGPLPRGARTRRAADPDLADVLGRTVGAAGHTVLVSGLTVGSALAALLLLGDPLLTGMAVGGLVSVSVVTAAGLSLAPALIALLHRRVPGADRGSWGRPARPPARALLARLTRVAQARPWPVLLVSAAAARRHERAAARTAAGRLRRPVAAPRQPGPGGRRGRRARLPRRPDRAARRAGRRPARRRRASPRSRTG